MRRRRGAQQPYQVLLHLLPLLLLHLLRLLVVGSQSPAAVGAAHHALHGGVLREAADGVVLLAAVAQQRVRQRHLLGAAHCDGSPIPRLLNLQHLLLLHLLGANRAAPRRVGPRVLALALLAADRVQRELALPARGRAWSDGCRLDKHSIPCYVLSSHISC